MSYETRCVCCDTIFEQFKKGVKESDQVCSVCQGEVIKTLREFWLDDLEKYPNSPMFYVLKEWDYKDVKG